MLLFKKKFLDAIRRGDKTQTIRLWKFRRMKAGQRSYIPGIGYIRIDSVEQIELDALTEQDALRDGFASVAQLRHELEQIYHDRQDDRYRPYRVIFSLLPSEQQVKKQPEPAEKRRRVAGSEWVAGSERERRVAGSERSEGPDR